MPIKKKRKDTPLKKNGLAPFLELKAKLTTQYSADTLKTIMVTSTSDQGGATTMVAGLAAALADDCYSKILIVNANFRSPTIHEYYAVEPAIGLSDLLSYEKNDYTLYKKVGQENIFILPPGKTSINTLLLFESTHFDTFLHNVRDKFDVVIFDVPPVLEYEETRIIGKKMDGVILVAEAGKTRRQVVQRAKMELEESGATLLGILLNRRRHYIPQWIYERL